MPADLLTVGFLSCDLFSGLPKNDELFYLGLLPPHFQRYKAVSAGEERMVLACGVVRRNESMVWEGSKSLLVRAVQGAAGRVRGVYSFELLAFNALKELNSFNDKELAQVLVNSSLRLQPGEDMLIRYSSVYGILRKLSDQTWGKMSFLSSVEVLAEEPGSLYALMGRALKKTEGVMAPVIVLIRDLSAVPLYDPRCEEQQSALKKLESRLSKTQPEFPRECWIEGVRVLPGGFELP